MIVLQHGALAIIHVIRPRYACNKVNIFLFIWQNTVDKLVQRANASLLIGTSSWKEQFAEALTVNPGDDDEEKSASCMDYVLHFITLFWKLIFAFVPPTGIHMFLIKNTMFKERTLHYIRICASFTKFARLWIGRIPYTLFLLETHPLYFVILLAVLSWFQ